MTNRLRLVPLAFAAALAACGDSGDATEPGLFLNEPAAVAVFRGLTTNDASVRPYLAIANASGNDLTILDARSDSRIPAPFGLRPLVFPLPGRPVLLASASLDDDPDSDPLNTEDDRPDLLVAVSAGQSTLQVLSTWTPDGSIAGEVELGGDILALVAVPSPAESARIAAALSNNRVAVVTFTRVSGSDAIDVAAAQATLQVGSLESGGIPLQPVALAAMPGELGRIWAATPDANGVAEVSVGGTPAVTKVLDALAPTRLVAAARLAERGNSPANLDPTTWSTLAPAARVYAVLDESGCGPAKPIECGLVALDADGTGLLPDFAGAEPHRAPIAVPGRALALAASGPPLVPPSTDPRFAPPFMRIVPGAERPTTGVAAVASSDGSVYFVDLGRWEIPGTQAVAAKATVVSVDPEVAVTVDEDGTPGYTPGTPTLRWTATFQGVLPRLEARRAQSGGGGTAPWIALQAGEAPSFHDVVQVADPAVGIQAGVGSGDLVVVTDPSGVGTCASPFDATVEEFLDANADHPGGALRVEAAEPQWTDCVAALGGGRTNLSATLRARQWVLVRGTGTGATQAGRPPIGGEHQVVTRRLSYVAESGDPVGAALRFTLELAPGVTTPTRGAAVVIDTTEGRAHFRAADPQGAAADPRAAVTFDRSPYVAAGGVRFLVPFASGVVLDSSPTQSGGGTAALR